MPPMVSLEDNSCQVWSWVIPSQLLTGFDGRRYCVPCVGNEIATLLEFLRSHDSFYEEVPERVGENCGPLMASVLRFMWIPRPHKLIALAMLFALNGFRPPWQASPWVLALFLLGVGLQSGFALTFGRLALYAFSREGTVNRSIFIKDGIVSFCRDRVDLCGSRQVFPGRGGPGNVVRDEKMDHCGEGSGI